MYSFKMLNLGTETKEIYVESPYKRKFCKGLRPARRIHIASTYVKRLTRRTSISFREFYQMKAFMINLQLHVITLLLMS